MDAAALLAKTALCHTDRPEGRSLQQNSAQTRRGRPPDAPTEKDLHLSVEVFFLFLIRNEILALLHLRCQHHILDLHKAGNVAALVFVKL